LKAHEQTSPEILFQKCQWRRLQKHQQGLKPLTESLCLIAPIFPGQKDDIFAKYSQISVWKNMQRRTFTFLSLKNIQKSPKFAKQWNNRCSMVMTIKDR